MAQPTTLQLKRLQRMDDNLTCGSAELHDSKAYVFYESKLLHQLRSGNIADVFNINNGAALPPWKDTEATNYMLGTFMRGDNPNGICAVLQATAIQNDPVALLHEVRQKFLPKLKLMPLLKGAQQSLQRPHELNAVTAPNLEAGLIQAQNVITTYAKPGLVDNPGGYAVAEATTAAALCGPTPPDSAPWPWGAFTMLSLITTAPQTIAEVFEIVTDNAPLDEYSAGTGRPQAAALDARATAVRDMNGEALRQLIDITKQILRAVNALSARPNMPRHANPNRAPAHGNQRARGNMGARPRTQHHANAHAVTSVAEAKATDDEMQAATAALARAGVNSATSSQVNNGAMNGAVTVHAGANAKAGATVYGAFPQMQAATAALARADINGAASNQINAGAVNGAVTFHTGANAKGGATVWGAFPQGTAAKAPTPNTGNKRKKPAKLTLRQAANASLHPTHGTVHTPGAFGDTDTDTDTEDDMPRHANKYQRGEPTYPFYEQSDATDASEESIVFKECGHTTCGRTCDDVGATAQRAAAANAALATSPGPTTGATGGHCAPYWTPAVKRGACHPRTMHSHGGDAPGGGEGTDHELAQLEAAIDTTVDMVEIPFYVPSGAEKPDDYDSLDFAGLNNDMRIAEAAEDAEFYEENEEFADHYRWAVATDPNGGTHDWAVARAWLAARDLQLYIDSEAEAFAMAE